MDLQEMNGILSNLKLDNNGKEDYLNNYKNLLENNNILLDTNKVIDIFNESINNCIQKDNLVQQEIDNIENKLKILNNKFIKKHKLCIEYIENYNKQKLNESNLLELYNTNIINLCIKNKEYNKMISDLLEQYNQKFEEYINQINETYPKNFLIQLVVNMIILKDLRNKTNKLFKNMLLEEVNKQQIELTTHINTTNTMDLNKKIMNECVNVDQLIEDIDIKTSIRMKEELIENMIREL